MDYDDKVLTPTFLSWRDRLLLVQRDGNLTVADLARWFDRPSATLHHWIKHDRQPGGGPIDREHAHQLMKLLETLIAKKWGLPVPPLHQRERIAYLKQLRDNCFPEMRGRSTI